MKKRGKNSVLPPARGFLHRHSHAPVPPRIIAFRPARAEDSPPTSSISPTETASRPSRIEPTSVAMKMARMYMTEVPTEQIEKVYRKGVRRLRYNQNVILAATWSWILLKRNGDKDEGASAFAALTEALKSSDNEILKRNHECLMNKRLAHFTNSGLGDQWYSLLLEEPRQNAHVSRPRSSYR